MEYFKHCCKSENIQKSYQFPLYAPEVCTSHSIFCAVILTVRMISRVCESFPFIELFVMLSHYLKEGYVSLHFYWHIFSFLKVILVNSILVNVKHAAFLIKNVICDFMSHYILFLAFVLPSSLLNLSDEYCIFIALYIYEIQYNK